MRSAFGFSTIEALVAMAVMLAIMAGAFTATRSSSLHAATELEIADMQQRLRVAASSLVRDLQDAGLGSYGNAAPGPLLDTVAPVRPYRLGGVVDPPGTFRTDTITVLRVAIGSTDVSAITYWLKHDAAAGVHQLMMSQGLAGPEVPVADNVVDLQFEYWGTPQPPIMAAALADPLGPWTTYGPKPALLAVPPYAAGENCVFVGDPAGTPQPRLAILGDGTGLVALRAAELTDGPWCPDAAAPDRWDADLLRIRSIEVTVRVKAASAGVRLPDQEAHVRVSPRNLNTR